MVFLLFIVELLTLTWCKPGHVIPSNGAHDSGLTERVLLLPGYANSFFFWLDVLAGTFRFPPRAWYHIPGTKCESGSTE